MDREVEQPLEEERGQAHLPNPEINCPALVSTLKAFHVCFHELIE